MKNRYCCECKSIINDKPIGITVCDSCKAKRLEQGHDIILNPVVKNRQGRKRVIAV